MQYTGWTHTKIWEWDDGHGATRRQRKWGGDRQRERKLMDCKQELLRFSWIYIMTQNGQSCPQAHHKGMWEVQVQLHPFLTLIPLTWRIWWAPHNASRWQMGFNLASTLTNIWIYGEKCSKVLYLFLRCLIRATKSGLKGWELQHAWKMRNAWRNSAGKCAQKTTLVR